MNNFARRAMALVACIFTVAALSGCQKDLVHQRPMAELNMKAQQMMQAGDYAGAASRLEAALDLQPDEPNTMHNLAIAYQLSGKYDQAIAMFEKCVGKPGIDQGELYKSLGITYEAKADALNGEAAVIEEKAGEGAPKPDQKAAMELKRDEAKSTYQIALEHYRKALPDLKNKTDVENQIKVLEEKLSNPDGADPVMPQ